MNQTPENDPELEFTPASPVKRTLAWIALSYMAIVVLLSFYGAFTGEFLGNLTPLMVLPALFGGGVLAWVAHKTEGRPSKKIAVTVVVIFWGLGVVTLPLAWVGLLSNF